MPTMLALCLIAMLPCPDMTVGIGTWVGDSIVLAADSRVSGDTLRYPDAKKLCTVGDVHLVGAGDAAQLQKALRQSEGVETALDLVSELERLEISDTEWLAVDGEGLHLIMPGAGDTPAYYIQPIPRDTWAAVGSGGLYVEGFLAAYGHPDTPDLALSLCKSAMLACSRRMLCVGGPFHGRTIPCH